MCFTEVAAYQKYIFLKSTRRDVLKNTTTFEMSHSPQSYKAAELIKFGKKIDPGLVPHYFQLRIDLRSILGDGIAHLSKFCREHSC